ncbi:hypothetical protein TIFTF001_031320 [Ficus carica]|uniref:Uncharacterized protein n=1 Tax=Ficus carica TaxID=3494 RepID=A0AA88DV43_FICCA|nr:hypothetical protein TIFTF001_031320 [Ficus carica]
MVLMRGGVSYLSPKTRLASPSMGTIKFNVVAAVNKAKDYIGDGVVARDDHGTVLGAATIGVSLVTSHLA